jgi:hypothetical protein
MEFLEFDKFLDDNNGFHDCIINTFSCYTTSTNDFFSLCIYLNTLRGKSFKLHFGSVFYLDMSGMILFEDLHRMVENTGLFEMEKYIDLYANYLNEYTRNRFKASSCSVFTLKTFTQKSDIIVVFRISDLKIIEC